MRNITIFQIKKDNSYSVSSDDGKGHVYSDNHATSRKANAFRKQAEDLGLTLVEVTEDEFLRQETYA